MNSPALDVAYVLGIFFYLLLIYRPLELAFPASRGQSMFRPGWSTDLCFFLGQYFLWIGLVLDVLGDFSPWLHGLVPPHLRRIVAQQPFWLQFLEVVLLGDFLIYWGHRLQHRVDWLWRFHSVHHSAEHLDWLAAHREHPIDTIYSVALMNLPAWLLGFSPAVMAGFISFRGLWSIFIHSNVRVSLGPLGLLIGSPAYHHWHHDRDRDSGNYGNVAPWLDLLFGTHHDPGREPESFGLRERSAPTYAGLLINPMLPRALHVGIGRASDCGAGWGAAVRESTP